MTLTKIVEELEKRLTYIRDKKKRSIFYEKWKD